MSKFMMSYTAERHAVITRAFNMAVEGGMTILQAEKLERKMLKQFSKEWHYDNELKYLD